MAWTPVFMGALAAFVSVSALVLLVLAGRAYRREHQGRFLLVSTIFAILVLKGLLMTAVLLSYVSGLDLRILTLGSDALLLLLLYLSIVR